MRFDDRQTNSAKRHSILIHYVARYSLKTDDHGESRQAKVNNDCDDPISIYSRGGFLYAPRKVHARTAANRRQWPDVHQSDRQPRGLRSGRSRRLSSGSTLSINGCGGSLHHQLTDLCRRKNKRTELAALCRPDRPGVDQPGVLPGFLTRGDTMLGSYMRRTDEKAADAAWMTSTAEVCKCSDKRSYYESAKGSTP
jgi:hypothetical protein